jgi:catechol 2,3-dioxygenase-like lactoylglutathione lyase family enzyme
VLGRFLEVSIHAPDVADSLAFYESLGFVQLPVGDTWRHAYGVVSDGRCVLGLHAYPFASPALTFVHAGLAAHAPRLRELGIEFAFAKLGDEQFHELGFLDPDGQMVTLLEARTWSPSGAALACGDSLLGHFEEVALPVTDLERTRALWEALGGVAFAGAGATPRRTGILASGLALGLYEHPLPAPAMVFTSLEHEQRIERLRAAGHVLESRPPRGLDPRDAALLRSAEGTPLLLLREVGEEAAGGIEVEET